jgi:hypothetical protein
MRKIFTVRDARLEKLLADANREARVGKAAAKHAKKPHDTNLHPRIGILNRWDRHGNPIYYIWQGDEIIASVSVEELMGYIR